MVRADKFTKSCKLKFNEKIHQILDANSYKWLHSRNKRNFQSLRSYFQTAYILSSDFEELMLDSDFYISNLKRHQNLRESL